MYDDSISIPVFQDNASGLPDALLRLQVLFPDCAFAASGNAIEVSGAIAGREREIVQVVADQVLRSTFDTNSSELRHRLYARLFG